MSAKANYFKIGVFVISAIILVVAAVIVLGAADLFRQKILVETYFEESVQGLDIGSPVKFRGVSIGNVQKITFADKEYPSEYRYVMVRASLFPDASPIKKGERFSSVLERDIQKGLRVRLAFSGITGTAFLEADFLDPNRNPPLTIDWKPLYPYVPSAPSTVTRLSESLDRIMRNLEQINIQAITDDLDKSLQAVARAVEEAQVANISGQTEKLIIEVRETNRRLSQVVKEIDLKPILSDASTTMADVRQMVENLKEALNQLLPVLSKTSASVNTLANRLESSLDIPETLAHLRRMSYQIDSLISRRQQDLEETIENIRLISLNIKELTDNVKRYPAQLLRGGPPVHSEVRSEPPVRCETGEANNHE